VFANSCRGGTRKVIPPEGGGRGRQERKKRQASSRSNHKLKKCGTTVNTCDLPGDEKKNIRVGVYKKTLADTGSYSRKTGHKK